MAALYSKSAEITQWQSRWLPSWTDSCLTAQNKIAPSGQLCSWLLCRAFYFHLSRGGFHSYVSKFIRWFIHKNITRIKVIVKTLILGNCRATWHWQVLVFTSPMSLSVFERFAVLFVCVVLSNLYSIFFTSFFTLSIDIHWYKCDK